MPQNIFISFSEEQKTFANQIKHALPEHSSWIYLHEVVGGDDIISQVGNNIDQSDIFIVILSEESIKSNWVKNELRIAAHKKVSDGNIRIIPVLFSNKVKIPSFLGGLAYIEAFSSKESAIQQIEIAVDKVENATQRRKFINRNSEFGKIQDWVNSLDTKFISLYGLAGIGKYSLVQESIKRIWSNISVKILNLSPGDIGAGLTLSLCAAANLDTPSDDIDQEERDKLNRLAIETICSSQSLLVLNGFESILNDDAEPNKEYSDLIEFFCRLKDSSEYPLFLLSRRKPKFPLISRNLYEELYIGEMTTKHIADLINIELSGYPLTQRLDQNQLEKIASQLHGYPLASRFVPSVLANRGIDYFLGNPKVISNLKVDIAKQILGKISLSDLGNKILELLALIQDPISHSELQRFIPNIDDETISEQIERLIDWNLIDTQGVKIQVHPLIRDHFNNILKEDDEYSEILERVKTESLLKLQSQKPEGLHYINLLKRTVRLFFFSGDYEGGRNIRKDLIGELKEAIVELYHQQKYKEVLEYTEEYLGEYPNDNHVKYYRARVLSKLNQPFESIDLLDSLISQSKYEKQKARYWQAKGRAYYENQPKLGSEYLDLAENAFNKALQFNEHHTSLRDLGVIYMRKGEQPFISGAEKYDFFYEAAGYFERALEIAPSEAYILSMYADVLWQLGRRKEAIEQIMEVIAYLPNDSSANFRAGRFLHEYGKENRDESQIRQAVVFFKKSFKEKKGFLDAELSLISALIDLGDKESLSEAKNLIGSLSYYPNEKREVVLGVKIDYYLKVGDLDEAQYEMNRLWKGGMHPDEFTRKASILIHQAEKAGSDGYNSMRENYFSNAKEVCNEGLQKFPENPHIKRQLERIPSRLD